MNQHKFGKPFLSVRILEHRTRIIFVLSSYPPTVIGRPVGTNAEGIAIHGAVTVLILGKAVLDFVYEYYCR